MRSLFVDGIFFQHAGAAAAVAQSHDRAVDAEDGVVGLRELEVVVGVIEVGSRIVEGGETEGSIDSLHTECFSTLGLEHDERTVFVRVGSKVWSQPAIAAWFMPYPLSLPRLQNTTDG